MAPLKPGATESAGQRRGACSHLTPTLRRLPVFRLADSTAIANASATG